MASMLCCSPFKGSLLTGVGSGARDWTSCSSAGRAAAGHQGPVSPGAVQSLVLAPRAALPSAVQGVLAGMGCVRLPWCGLCRCQPVPHGPLPSSPQRCGVWQLLALLRVQAPRGRCRGRGRSHGVACTLPHPLPPWQGSWQQPCQDSRNWVALPAVLGAAVPTAGPHRPHPCALSTDEVGAKITAVPTLLAACPSAGLLSGGGPAPMGTLGMTGGELEPCCRARPTHMPGEAEDRAWPLSPGCAPVPAWCRPSAPAQPCSSQPGPLRAAPHRAGALAACAGPSPSASRAGRRQAGHGATRQPRPPWKHRRPLPMLQPALWSLLV